MTDQPPPPPRVPHPLLAARQKVWGIEQARNDALRGIPRRDTDRRSAVANGYAQAMTEATKDLNRLEIEYEGNVILPIDRPIYVTDSGQVWLGQPGYPGSTRIGRRGDHNRDHEVTPIFFLPVEERQTIPLDEMDPIDFEAADDG